jgi:hypothetical protein
MQHQLLGPSSSEEDLANGLGISQMPQSQPHVNGVPFSNDLAAHVQLQNVNYDGGLLAAEMYANADMNRRTITQETFNEMTRHGGMVNGSGQFESLDMAFSGDQDTLGQVFAGYDPKHDAIPLGYPQIAQPLSSNDSTVPSVVSEQSMHAFPSSNMMQHHASMSAPGSDWTDSRSSSLASSQHEAMGMPLLPVHSQPHPTTSQWEPGQSVPVNVDAMKDEFQQVAAQANLRASMDQGQEQPLAYPPDDAYVRRGSTASMLAQSMCGVGLHTPQLDQSNGPFKQPPPPAATIAARRQKRTPANLGIASMRSQSFGGPGQPSSPGYQHNLQQGQSVRRVMSSNVLNGVVQGRVMKSVPGSAQRSPLNWTFNDAMNSPHLVRAVSHGNLAPPTPVTPVHPNQTQQVPNLPVASGQFLQQQSIGENEDQGVAVVTQYPPPSSVPQHVSPPHTPHFYQQPFVPYRIGSNVIVENTPPQSAPASQTTFPSNVFGAPPPPPNPHLAAMANAQHQQYLNLAVPEQPFQMSNVTFAPSQHATVVASGPAPGAPLTFATGVPVRTADGNVQMSFPAQMQMMQPSQSPPQVPFAFVNSNGASGGAMSAAQPPKLATQPASDFVVHEYSPPDSIKRSVSPRKVADSGPRSYSFAHTGPVDFEEKRLKKEASSSPVSSNGTTATL